MALTERPLPPDAWLRDNLREHYVQVADARLHVVEAGSGPPVMLIHGFPDFWFVWRHQIRGLASAGFRVIAPDLRGFNLSSKPKDVQRYHPEVLAQDIDGLARHFGLEDAMMVAHDWGGVAAWHSAMRRPSWLRRLAIINSPHPVSMLRRLRTLPQMKRSWYIFYFQLPWIPEVFLKRGRGATLVNILKTNPEKLNAFSQEDIEYCVDAHLKPGALRGALSCYRAAVRAGRRRFAGPHTAIETPTLVLWGDADQYLLPAVAAPPAELVPNCVVRHFPGASHWLMIDRPEEVNRALIEHAS